ncbi:hypothetical protein MANES_12G028500v8 [Manihot esculenta]|uniref:Rapid ALkalinization Factor n=1 Tax=Manihot esculenta TaxID=3983 RepID=A0A2C9UT83_MANES|nr:hypothetical protein MANES_12G028500v8 [Manihot esculenta]
MKSFILGLALINLIMLNHHVRVEAVRYLEPGVLDPCIRSGNKLPGCDPNKNQPRKEANPYQRGCSAITRCRN